jgi:hypothetical protein
MSPFGYERCCRRHEARNEEEGSIFLLSWKVVKLNFPASWNTYQHPLYRGLLSKFERETAILDGRLFQPA